MLSKYFQHLYNVGAWSTDYDTPIGLVLLGFDILILLRLVELLVNVCRFFYLRKINKRVNVQG